MEKMVARRQAPRNAVPRKHIPMNQLFSLNVDDEIWQDVGLTDQWDDSTPPPWLADDSVRSGIRGMLDIDRSQEELVRLSHERDAMQCWFSEEWAILAVALEETSEFCGVFDCAHGLTMRAVQPDALYQLLQKKEDLLHLCCQWQADLGDMRASEGIPAWGPSPEELRDTRLDMRGEFLDAEGRGEAVYGHRTGMEGFEDEEDVEDEVVDCDEDIYNTVIAFDTVEGRDIASDVSDTDQ
ncbi:hypothetical protein V5O48_014855 [Marasmius crinis-equi]|uniref:Uncharacterized protein n=1 Tax=Marasmius crinis-equi TaxID=585013 RepID=A0ABR3EW36_9AGAR